VYLRRSAVALFAGVLVGAIGSAVGAHAATVACSKSSTRGLVLISARTGAVDCSFPDVRGTVNAVLADGHGGWFVGGSFAGVGNVAAPTLVHLESDGSLDRAWHASLPAAPQVGTGYPTAAALARFGATLYAGGSFGVEALDAATGRRLWLTAVSGKPGVLALAASGQHVYVGGDFSSVDGKPRRSLAMLDPHTGHPPAWHAPSLGGSPTTVAALALAGSRLYIGGSTITSVGGRARPGLASVDARTGSPTSWVPGNVNGGRGVGDVETILITHGQVLTAGHDGFGITDARIGTVEKWMYGVHGVGAKFAVSGNTVYLGGNIRNSFDAVAGKRRNNLAAFDLATGQFSTWAPKINRYVGVDAMAASSNQVLVAGFFSKTL
jgi:hypothetical protein